jgi:lipoprotein-anchoring transpeptidase ErfK/SrfK
MRVHGNDGTGARRLLALGNHRHRLLVFSIVLAILALLATGCSGVTAHTAPHVKRVTRPAVRIVITPVSGARDARPTRGVTVTVSHGTLQAVTVAHGQDMVRGKLNAARTAWHTSWPLQPGRAYKVWATAMGSAQQAVTETSAFRTLRPAHTVHASVLEGYHQAYGVGIPIMITFSHPVTRKAAVERSIRLRTSKPVVGAWYWDSSTSLVFRPRTYWPQHTRVSFVAHLDGLEVAPGVYGTADLSQSFHIGASLIAVVSARTHYENIYYRGKLMGHWPVSTGAPGDDTADGTYLTIEKGNPVLMSGPGYTNFPVPYSVRFTWSGNFMHDAYWSVGEQGFANVSHGCVNMSPEHARIYYDLAVPGDPVTITGSPVAGGWDDGWTEWFLGWKQLLRGSATHRAVKAGPSGSSLAGPATLPPTRAKAPLHRPRPHNALAA